MHRKYVILANYISSSYLERDGTRDGMEWRGSAALGGKTGEVHDCLYRHCLCTRGTQRNGSKSKSLKLLTPELIV